jgi:hypothetical protein
MITYTLLSSQNGTRVRLDCASADTVQILVGSTAETWTTGAYIEIVNISVLASMTLVAAPFVTLNALGNSAALAYGEYARVSYVGPGVWDLHVYKQPTVLPDYTGVYAPLVHTHIISDVTGLQTALNTKVDTSTFTTALGTKVDTTVFGTALSAKVDVTTFNTALGTKVDTTTFTTALADKVDTTTFTTALATKVDTTTFTTALADKVDTTTFNTALATKVDTTTFNTALATKVDTTTFTTALAGKVDTATFATSVNTQVASLLSAGTGISLSYTAPNGPLVISATPTTLGPIKPAPLVTVIDAVSTTKDFGSSAEHNTHYRLGAATDIAVMVQPDSNWTGTDTYLDNNFNPINPGPMPVGGSAIFTKTGTGNITFVPGSGVTINTPDGLTVDKLMGKATIIKVASNVWDVSGYLAAAVVAPTYTYTLRSGTATTYWTTYQAAFSAATFTNFSDTFDAAQLPSGATLTDPTTINLVRSGFNQTPTAIGVTQLALTTNFEAWEFTVGTFTGTGTVGYWTVAYGPPFDPNTANGGPLGSYYSSNGYVVGFSGGVSAPNAPTWTTGDIIGAVYDNINANIVFFKNGVNVGTAAVVNQNGYTMCGLL